MSKTIGGYTFKNMSVLTLALTHSSFSENNYERLEFLGDSILDFLLADILYENKKYKEAELTRARANLACEEQVAQMRAECHAAELDMNERIASMQQTVQQTKDEQLALHARLHAYQSKHGEQIDVDLTDKENFLLLAKERAWFEKLFQQTWSQTKKRIRKDLLWKMLHKNNDIPENGANEGTSHDD